MRQRDHFYGKGDVLIYRTGVRPLTGVRPIPESGFTGRAAGLFGVNVAVLVRGAALLPAYTAGDNASVVATDSMKNFIQRNAAEYQGATLEGFLHFVGRRFLERYRQMESVTLTGREIPFTHVQVGGGATSEVLLKRGYGESATAMVELARAEDGATLTDHRAGIVDLQLVKLRGNSFAGFVRDEFTTLPEAHDRALFAYLDVHWQYAHGPDGLGDDPARYVPAEQVRDLVQTVFHERENRSIQELIHQIGERMLDRFEQLAEVRFDAQNHTWESVAASADGGVKVYTEPRPPYGIINLTMRAAGEG